MLQAGTRIDRAAKRVTDTEQGSCSTGKSYMEALPSPCFDAHIFSAAICFRPSHACESKVSCPSRYHASHKMAASFV